MKALGRRRREGVEAETRHCGSPFWDFGEGRWRIDGMRMLIEGKW